MDNKGNRNKSRGEFIWYTTYRTYIADESISPLMNSMADPPRSEIGCILISTSLFFLFISFLNNKASGKNQSSILNATYHQVHIK